MKSTRSPLGLFSMISVFLIGSGAVVDCPCHPRSLQARSGPDGSQTANREGFDVGITPPDAEIFRKFLHGRILFAVASLVALTAGIRLLANEDIPLWVHSAGGTSPSDELHSTAIAVGPDGSTYVAGRLRGTARLGDTHLIATNRSIVFVAKLTRSGQWAWAREECSSTDGVVECHGIAVNSSNYIFLVGRYRKDARVGDSWLRGRSEYDSAFIVRLSPDGTPSGVYGLTGESIDNPARATIRQVWVDGSDAVYVAGALTSRARFGNTLIEGGLSSGFVARLDMGSEWKWVLTISGDGISSCQGLAGDSSGLYVTGTFQGQNRFGNVTHIATNQAAFVAGLSKSGEFLWTTTLTASTNAGSMAVTPDRAGGAWIAGYFNGTVTPSTDSNLQHAGGFVARLKAGGDLAWIRQVGSAGSLPGSLSLSAEGDCYLAGQLFTPQATGPLGLTMPPDWEGYAAGYLAKLSGGGELLWAINAGTTTGEFPPLASRGALTAFAGSLRIPGRIFGRELSKQGGFSAFVGNLTTSPQPAIFVDGMYVVAPVVNARGPAKVTILSGFLRPAIYYTLDGSPPSFDSQFYSGEFTIEETTTIRAIAYHANFVESVESEPITVTMPRLLDLVVETDGGGQIRFDPPGRGGQHPANTDVVVTAYPTSSWEFLGWEGDVAATNNPLTVSVVRNTHIKAIFGTRVQTRPSGAGRIQLRPALPAYPFGTTLSVTALPEPGHRLAAWGNAVSGNTNPLALIVSNPSPTISALFTPLQAGEHSLVVSVDGEGQAAVLPRANHYETGQSVRISAVPKPGQEFIGWGGDAVGAENPLVHRITRSAVIAAIFTKRPRLMLESSTSLGDEGDVFRIAATGIPPSVMRIERSPDLRNWSDAALLTNRFGWTRYHEPIDPTANTRFFRVTPEFDPVQ